ncbi:permease prefix domain 1-containing protein [Oscillospiraceae bacterium OttesenSCG-928-G22]|nr:permease prefix domain 1-containing protein [Oscillospiraceae bacterium OttesenSCG-928-G22]
MKEKIRAHVESLFLDAPKTRRTNDLKEELILGLEERYDDLLKTGTDEETAFGAVIAGIGDVDELISGLRRQDILNPVEMQVQRKRSAVLISGAVGLYIISLIFPIVFGAMSGHLEILGIVLMISCWAVATVLLVYNAISKPKYMKVEETIVEEFKEWKQVQHKNDAVQKSIQSIIWTLSVVIFFLLGFFANGFHYAWLVFILAAAGSQIVRLVYASKEGE